MANMQQPIAVSLPPVSPLIPILFTNMPLTLIPLYRGWDPSLPDPPPSFLLAYPTWTPPSHFMKALLKAHSLYSFSPPIHCSNQSTCTSKVFGKTRIIHVFIQQLFTCHLFCLRDYIKPWVYTGEQNGEQNILILALFLLTSASGH